MQTHRPIMFVGTASNVGKTWLCAGVGRWLKNKGYNPAPFKAQNMSLNSFITPDNKEISTAQAMQAEACNIACSVDMNPILLKPTSNNVSQLIVRGEMQGNQSAKSYFKQRRDDLFEIAKQCFSRLQSQYSPIVMEGAGSISELNLKAQDIVNMPMAKVTNACVYLVANIDNGGVFASLHGTIDLLEDWERALIKGIIINKFRGDISLFKPSIQRIERLTKTKVLGVLPYIDNILIEEEDSVALQTKHTKHSEHHFNIAIIRLPHISNYTDFQVFETYPEIHAFYTLDTHEIQYADIIIIPGTKNTIADLEYIKQNGIADVIKKKYETIPIIGICGGYQMLGKFIEDPLNIEGKQTFAEGLGIFDCHTTMTEKKHTVQTTFTFKHNKEHCTGYEVHIGKTIHSKHRALNSINGKQEGYFDGKLSWGTYIHGIFNNPVVLQDLITHIQHIPIRPSYDTLKEQGYETLAHTIDTHIDMQQILKDIRRC